MKARKLILSACTAIILAVPSLAQTPPPATARTTASPGTEETLRRIINGFIKGQPDVDEMAPNLANVVKAQSAAMQPVFSKLGALTTLTFKGVGPSDVDIYEGDFEHGQTEWRIAPLDANGKVASLNFRPAAPGSPQPPPHAMPVSWPVLNLTPRILTTGSLDYWPCFSPDGKTVLFSRNIDGQHWVLYDVPASGGEAKPLTTASLPISATRADWSKSGKIAFTGESNGQSAIWVAAADGSGAHAVPTPTGSSQQFLYPSWYPDGAHVAAMDGENLVIRRVDLTNGATTLATDHTQVLTGMPSVSPDGAMIAFAGQKNAGQPYNQEENVIWLVDSAGQLSTLEAKPVQGRAPVWSPDGKYLSFESDRGPSGQYAIFIIKRDGTGLTQLTDYKLNATHGVFSPDGRHMVFAAMETGGRNSGIAIIDLPER
jgi:dipeptidyl aminopeptidase/acylaminoacyl peptidase